MTVCQWTNNPALVSVEAGLVSLPAHCLIEGVNGKFTSRPKLTLLGLFNYFWVYISE